MPDSNPPPLSADLPFSPERRSLLRAAATLAAGATLLERASAQPASAPAKTSGYHR